MSGYLQTAFPFPFFCYHERTSNKEHKHFSCLFKNISGCRTWFEAFYVVDNKRWSSSRKPFRSPLSLVLSRTFSPPLRNFQHWSRHCPSPYKSHAFTLPFPQAFHRIKLSIRMLAISLKVWSENKYLTGQSGSCRYSQISFLFPPSKVLVDKVRTIIIFLHPWNSSNFISFLWLLFSVLFNRFSFFLNLHLSW